MKPSGKKEFLAAAAVFTAGLLFVFVIGEAAVRIGGRLWMRAQENRARAAKDKRVILCVGDSVTALGGAYSYPSLLGNLLNSSGRACAVVNKGLPNTTSQYAADNIERFIKEYRPDIVVSLIGINDISPVRYYDSVSDRDGVFFKLSGFYRFSRLVFSQGFSKLRRDTDLKSAGWKYLEERMWPQAKDCFIKAIVGSPRDPEAFRGLGVASKELMRFDDAELYFRKAIEYGTPRKYDTLLTLSQMYCATLRFEKAKNCLIEAIRIEPYNDLAYADMAALCTRLDEGSLAVVYSDKAIELNPSGTRAYADMSAYYLLKRDYEAAEKMALKAVEIDPLAVNPRIVLGKVYMARSRRDAAVKVLNEALNIEPGNDRARRFLAAIYMESGDQPMAAGQLVEAERYTGDYTSEMTGINYRKIYRITRGYNIPLVAVQYPMRSVSALKDLFADVKEGIYFVDNESSFKKSVAESGFSEYFTDMFAGDFGHGTAAGNELLARNIARVLDDAGLH